jgi:predicted nucleic-acid-binding Zn-ribbon protein
MSYNCPKCNSDRIYQEVTIVAKQDVKTSKIFDIEKGNIDCIFEPYYCLDCGWSDLDQTWNKKGGGPDYDTDSREEYPDP